MIRGEDKKRQIARSLLPASRSSIKGIRDDKRNWNQQARRRMDREIQDFFSPGDTALSVIDAFDASERSLWVDAYTPEERWAMGDIRDDRRLRDKLGPVMRWTASRKADFDDSEELIQAVARDLPDNLAGRHALTHIRSKFSPRDRYFFPSRYNPRDIAAEIEVYARWENVVATLIERSHAEFNRRIKIDNSDRGRCWMCKIESHGSKNDAEIRCSECHRVLKNNIVPASGTGDAARIASDVVRNRYGRSFLIAWCEKEFERVTRSIRPRVDLGEFALAA